MSSPLRSRWWSLVSNQCPHPLQASPPDLDPTDSPSLWESKMKMWMERYEEASSNQYSEEMQILLRLKGAAGVEALTYSGHGAAFKPPVEVRGGGVLL